MVRDQSQKMDMTEGQLFGKMLLFCLPVMATGILQLLYNAADLVVVGRYASDTALAAVGATGSLGNLIVNLMIGLSVGANVAAAQFIGSREYDNVTKVAHTAVVVAVIGGVIVGVFGMVFARPLLTMTDTPEEVIEQSVLYMRIIFAGMPALMVYNFGAAILRAGGDTRRPLLFLTISGLLNVGLNLMFVIGFGCDVDGVAYATIISQYFSAFLTLFYMFRMKGCCQLRMRLMHPDRRMFLLMVRIGLPAGIQGMLFSISNVLIQSSINSFGPAAMTGNAAAGNVDGFIYTACNSVYHAALAFTGQNVGANRLDRVRRVVLDSVIIVTVIGLLIGIPTYLNGEFLLRIYEPDNAEAIAFGMVRLRWLASTYFVCGIMDTGCGLLRGMGKSVLSMMIALVGACFFRVVWILTVFRFQHSLDVLYLSYPISWVLTAFVDIVLVLVILHRMIAKQKKEISVIS